MFKPTFIFGLIILTLLISINLGQKLNNSFQVASDEIYQIFQVKDIKNKLYPLF